MPDGFETLIDEANAFHAELAANNRKDWYEPRKDHYRDAIKKPAELLRDLVAEDLSRLTGRAMSGKLFRIHRDVRFSKDKSPYNPHLHLIWQEAGQIASPGPDRLDDAFFFAARPGAAPSLAHGVMAPAGPALTRLRAFVAEWGGLIADAMDEMSARGIDWSGWGPEPLKRVPKPYPPDHPQADLLKRKALIVEAPLREDWRERGVVAAIRDRAEDMAPLTRLLSERL